MNLDIESRHKLRDMGASHLLDALEAQDDAVCMGLTFAERLQMAVDEAYSDYINKTVAGLIKKAKLRIPQADVRTIDYLEGRNLDRQTLVELSTCGFVNRCDNVVFEGFSGSGKTFLSNAYAKECCRNRYRTLYIRMQDLEELRREHIAKYGTDMKLVTKLANYQVLVLDEWLFSKPSEEFRNFLLEVTERKYMESTIIVCTQFRKGDWHARLGGGVQADAIMDRIVHNTVWVSAGDINMREHYAKKDRGACSQDAQGRAD